MNPAANSLSTLILIIRTPTGSLWGVFFGSLTIEGYYRSIPTEVGTSDYYHRIIEMGNGAKHAKGRYRSFYYMLLAGQVLTIGIGLFGLVKVFENHDTHGESNKSDGILKLTTFVLVNFLAIGDVSIQLPDAPGHELANDEGCMELSQKVFPKGELARYYDKIDILAGPRQAISDSNYFYAIDCESAAPQ